LPVLDKRHLMDSYDDVVTDRAVRLARLREHLASGDDTRHFRGRYRVCATSGTTGQPGVFLYDPVEWGWVVASYARANAWSGVPAGLFHRLRIAMVGSSKAWHQSGTVARELDCAWVPSLRLAATDPLPELCERLTAWQPRLLITYAAMASILADEQIAGRLAIAPQAVMCVAERLTGSMREKIRAAWGAEPFENYASTETACIAAECEAHAGMHTLDDLLVVECVDEKNQPVPAGEMGAKVLVSVLYSRTVPLIRYELDDGVSLTEAACSCGRPFARITRIGGRIAETLRIQRRDGTIAVLHPTQLEDTIGLTDVKGWQVIRDGDAMRVFLQVPLAGETRRRIVENVEGLIRDLGIQHIALSFEEVDAIPRSASGKMVLVHDKTAA
jgi:phenylacetate-CoA ligase